MIAVSVIGLLIGLVLGPLGDFYVSNTTLLGVTTQETDTRSTLRQMESDLANSTGFNTVKAAAAPLGAKNGGNWDAQWSYKGMGGDFSSRRVLLADVPATTIPPSTDTANVREPVFVANFGGSCPDDPDVNMLAKATYVYYMAPDKNADPNQPPSSSNPYNLYRRTIVAPGPYCYGKVPAQKNSCAPGYSHAGCAGLGTDAVFLRNIYSFTVDYYQSPDAATPIAGQYSASPAAPIEQAQSIKITVTTIQKNAGKETEKTATIRISRAY